MKKLNFITLFIVTLLNCILIIIAFFSLRLIELTNDYAPLNNTKEIVECINNGDYDFDDDEGSGVGILSDEVYFEF